MKKAVTGALATIAVGVMAIAVWAVLRGREAPAAVTAAEIEAEIVDVAARAMKVVTTGAEELYGVQAGVLAINRIIDSAIAAVARRREPTVERRQRPALAIR